MQEFAWALHRVNAPTLVRVSRLEAPSALVEPLDDVGGPIKRFWATIERGQDCCPVAGPRNGAPFKDWILPASLERVRRKLAAAPDGGRQMVSILTAVLSDGLPAVEAACGEALAEGVHSADVILNILARAREPARTITIMTPDALRLNHEPIADCARYDNLRRAL
jgi:hypothetical protein